MFKNMRLIIIFDIFLSPSFKMTTSFANIARTTVSTSDVISDINHGHFYCLNYISLLVNLITTPVVSQLYHSSIIFILSDTNYRHLLLP